MVFWRNLYELCAFVYTWCDNARRSITHIVNNALAVAKPEAKPAIGGREFKVYIYEAELEKIERWVKAFGHIETGGDLFGLWIDKHSVVVQFVLGPGKNCRRTATSFYQDTEYLASVGGYLTTKQGLCNIGQWHSHHRMDLPKPSFGDENTVWNNMPGLDMERFVVFIATIKDSGMSIFQESETINVNCFLFEIDNETKTQLPVLEGEICVMEQGHSPMYECRELNDLTASGMEPDNHNDYGSVAVGMPEENYK